jgi:CRISPR system Cascade subunit CasD
LGIERGDDAGQEALATGYRFGVKLHAVGHPLRDFHTIQVGPQLTRLRYRTRHQELTLSSREQLGTLLSSREYRCDSFTSVAAVATQGAPRQLRDVAAALARPVFLLYLGRKSCPLAVPLAARVAEFPSLRAALDAFDPDPLPELVSHLKDEWRPSARNRTRRLLGFGSPRYYWDDTFGADGLADGLPAGMTLVRHDEPLSRRRWQFAPRREHVLLTEGKP